mmetsp:Transcript_20543/g.56725  ORF Transcript_20543/g.56725 Transcript_20543/m.56725 type:complete len:153 (-) Transcript_20543:79-537(-)
MDPTNIQRSAMDTHTESKLREFAANGMRSTDSDFVTKQLQLLLSMLAVSQGRKNLDGTLRSRQAEESQTAMPSSTRGPMPPPSRYARRCKTKNREEKIASAGASQGEFAISPNLQRALQSDNASRNPSLETLSADDVLIPVTSSHTARDTTF